MVNPYPKETPSQLLKRVVQLPDTNWTSATLPVTSFYPIEQILFRSLFHRQILGNIWTPGGTTTGIYRYLRCGVRVTVKLNSTQYHQGTLLASWLPVQIASGPLNATYTTKGFLASMPQTVILSASTQDQCTIHIPFMGTYPHHDMLDFGAAQDAFFILAVLNPLTTSSPSVVDTVPVSIFLELEDIETYGYLPPSDETLKGMTHHSVSVADGMFASTNSKDVRNVEAQTKDNQGISAKPKTTLTGIFPILRSIPWVSTVIDIGKMIFANLDKPTTDQALTLIAERPHRGHTQMNGLDYTEPLSSYTSYQVTKRIMLESSDQPVCMYVQKPALFYTTQASNAGVIIQLPVHPMKYASSSRTEPDYLAFGTSMFQYWRGGIKFMVQFVGTPFYSARFKISISHTYPTIPTSTGNGTGYTSRIIDVKGDAWTDFVVPSLTPNVWNNRSLAVDPRGFSWMSIELLTNVQGSSLPATAFYYINIWRAAASDYQLAQAVPAEDWDTGSFEVDMSTMTHQTSITQQFSKNTDGVQTQSMGMMETGISMADTSTTLTDLCKRFVPHQPSTTGPYSYPQQDLTLSTFSRDAFHILAFAFLFWRGSRRLKSATTDYYATIPPGNTFSYATSRQDGQPMVLDNVNPGTSATVPWYCQRLMSNAHPFTSFSPSPGQLDNPVDAFQNTAFSAQNWIAAGDDFQYIFPLPPIITLFLPTQSPPPPYRPLSELPVIQGKTESKTVTTTTTTTTALAPATQPKPPVRLTTAQKHPLFH